jgi:transposase InsO family protein
VVRERIKSERIKSAPIKGGAGADAYSYEALYAIAGMTRQGYTQRRLAEQRRASEAAMVLEQVHAIRRILPRTGGRKLWKALGSWCRAQGVRIGRNRLFSILREAGELIRMKRRYARTTDSAHGFAVAPNRLVGLRVDRPTQVWVSDITYIRTREGFVYVSLITDAYSRKIIGSDVSNSLSIEGSLRSLKRAMGQQRDLSGVIHHSDRGVQYCSGAYRERLASRGMIASMASTGNPYENAIAERVNGILKQEFGLDATFATLVAVRRALAEAITLYNTRRLHQSLGYRIPADVHAKSASLNTLHSTHVPVNV